MLLEIPELYEDNPILFSIEDGKKFSVPSLRSALHFIDEIAEGSLSYELYGDKLDLLKPGQSRYLSYPISDLVTRLGAEQTSNLLRRAANTLRFKASYSPNKVIEGIYSTPPQALKDRWEWSRLFGGFPPLRMTREHLVRLRNQQRRDLLVEIRPGFEVSRTYEWRYNLLTADDSLACTLDLAIVKAVNYAFNTNVPAGESELWDGGDFYIPYLDPALPYPLSRS